jgi:hypothetical protein
MESFSWRSSTHARAGKSPRKQAHRLDTALWPMRQAGIADAGFQRELTKRFTFILKGIKSISIGNSRGLG